MPKCGNSASPGAEAPKPFMPMKAPRGRRASGPSQTRTAASTRDARRRAEHRVLIVLRRLARRAPSTASRRPPRGSRPAPSLARGHRDARPRSRSRAASPGAARQPRPAHRRRAPSGFPHLASCRSSGSDWRVSASERGAVAPLQRQRPAFRRLDRVGRAETLEAPASRAARPDARPADASARPRRARSNRASSHR